MKRVIEFKIHFTYGCGIRVTTSAMERTCSLITNMFMEYIEKIEICHLDRLYTIDECFVKVTFKKKLNSDLENDIIEDLKHLLSCIIKADDSHPHYKLYHHIVKATSENEHIELYDAIIDNDGNIKDEYLIIRSFTLLSGHFISISSFYYKDK